MQTDDQGNTAEGAADTSTLQTTLFPLPESRPLLIRELLTSDQPRNRHLQHGASALSDAELLTIITGTQCLETAQRLLIAAGGLRGLHTISAVELQRLINGISVGRAAQLKAAIELGMRVVRGELLERLQMCVSSELLIVPARQGPLRSAALSSAGEPVLPVTRRVRPGTPAHWSRTVSAEPEHERWT